MDLNKGIDDALKAKVELKIHAGADAKSKAEEIFSAAQINSNVAPSSTSFMSDPIPLKRVLPDPDPYPVRALGPLLSKAVNSLAKTIQAPVALCAQSVLAGATLAVQGHADVGLDGRVYPLSEFFLTIAESGERKSAVDRIVMREFREREKQLSVAYKSEKLKYVNLTAAYEKKRGETKNGDLEAQLKALGTPPLEPLLPMLLCDEPTIEGIWKLAELGQPSFGIFSDEGGRMIGGHGMSQENQIRTVTGLSKFWDGDPLSRVRGGDGAKVLSGRRLSMHLMVQPAVVASLLTNEIIQGQGILSRVLSSFPASTVGTRNYCSIDLSSNTDMLAFHERIREIIHSPFPLSDGSRNELQPRVLSLSTEAKAVWVGFHDSIEEQLRPDAQLSVIRGFAAKAAEHVLRLAATLTLFDSLATQHVQRTAIENAIDLVQFYLSEAIRLYHSSTTSPELNQAERLLEWARKQCTVDQPYIYLPHVYQYGPNSVRDAKKARALLAVLESHRWIIRVPGNVTIDGKSRNEVWRIWRPSHV